MRRRPASALSCLLSFCLLPAGARGGFYDFDYTLDHQKGLPSVEAILAGKFQQHSTDYYEEAIPAQRRRSKPRYIPGQPIEAADATIFASALARTGDLAGALEAVDPQRNLATDSPIENSMRASILMALGDYSSAVRELETFLQRSPASPFGREAYELKLAKYLLAVQTNRSVAEREPTFVRGLLLTAFSIAPNAATRRAEGPWWEQAPANPQEVQKALTAISAMIRFGDLGSAHLYAAMGDLLRVQGDAPMAYRAYRRAIEHAHPWPDAIQREIDSIRQELGQDERISESTINAEQHSAEAWVKAYQAFEMRLLREGKLQSFQAYWEPFYAEHGNLREPPITRWMRITQFVSQIWPALTVITMILLVSAAILIRRLRERFGAGAITAAD